MAQEKLTDGLNLGWGKKLPLVLQTEAAECALACLAMVAGYHGYKTDLQHLRTRFTVSLKGMTLAQLLQIAGQMNLSCRPIRVDLEALPQLATPCILHWDLNHFVVLRTVRGQKVMLHNPAVGEVTMTMAEASKHFTGVAVELEPNLQFQRKTERQSIRLRGLMGRVRGLKTALLQALMLALALEIFSLLGPFLMQWIVDDALVSGDKDLLTVIVMGIFGLSVLKLTVSAIRAWVLMHMGTSLNLQWVANVLRHMLRLPAGYFEKRHMGDIISRFGAISAIQQTLTTSFLAAVLDGLMAVTTLVMMLVYSPQLAAIALGAVVVYGVVRVLRYDALQKASEGQIVLQAQQQSHFMETIRGIQTIKLFNRQADRQSRYLKMVVDSTNSGIAVQRMSITFQTVNAFLVAVEGTLILWIGSKLVLDQAFTIGMLMAFISYKDQFTGRISSLIDKVFEVKMLRMQAERLADIVLSPPEADTPQAYLAAEGLPPTLELRNVQFRYADGEPWVLNGVNLKVGAGEAVVLIGPSGCGKSTLLKIMLGLLPPVTGEVLVGGVPLAQLGLSHYRGLIGAVMQDDRLFAGSLADNISFFDSTPNQTHIEACARLANIHLDITRMPMGYNTLVGDMGTTLSGGQKQRVFLARALYKKPQFLFLDEATSHLDTALEKDITAAIAELQLTRIAIAHRPETISASGRVIALGKPALALQI